MSNLVGDIYRRRDLLLLLVGRNLKIRYKSSALGFFWSLLGPVLLIAIYGAFLSVLRFEIRLSTLVTGIIVWQFLAMCLGDSLHAIVGNANLVTKASFPRAVLPLATVAANLVNFLLSLAVVLVFLAVTGTRCGPVLLVPLAALTQTALCLGAGFLLAASNVFFRDTEHILSVAMLAWFFMTPIIYPIDLVTGPASGLPWWVAAGFFLNPMTGIVTTYRMALLSDPNPGTALLAMSYVAAWGVLAVGTMVFRRAEARFGDEL